MTAEDEGGAEEVVVVVVEVTTLDLGIPMEATISTGGPSSVVQSNSDVQLGVALCCIVQQYDRSMGFSVDQLKGEQINFNQML